MERINPDAPIVEVAFVVFIARWSVPYLLLSIVVGRRALFFRTASIAKGII
jgi:hypothetical protein